MILSADACCENHQTSDTPGNLFRHRAPRWHRRHRHLVERPLPVDGTPHAGGERGDISPIPAHSTFSVNAFLASTQDDFKYFLSIKPVRCAHFIGMEQELIPGRAGRLDADGAVWSTATGSCWALRGREGKRACPRRRRRPRPGGHIPRRRPGAANLPNFVPRLRKRIHAARLRPLDPAGTACRRECRDDRVPEIAVGGRPASTRASFPRAGRAPG